MQYLLLIYENEALAPNLDPAARNQMFGRYMKLSADLRAAGAFIAGDALHPVATATTVRVRGGTRTTTDGPFAETKEQLGGYYLIEAPDLDAAIAWAEQVPASEIGSVEIRPVMLFE